MAKTDETKFVPMGTKISPEMAVVWDAVCQALGTDTYHMLQHFIYVMCRAASEQHELTPEIKKLMAVFDTDVGWQNALNLCAPNGRLSISQLVLIVEQEGKKGVGAVLINKPFMGEATQTECVDDIFENVTRACMQGIYKKLRRLAEDIGCESQADLLLTMIDAYTIQHLEEMDRYEMKGEANFSEYGRPIEYGKRHKRIRRRTPDSLANSQQRIVFDDIDRENAKAEVEDWEGEQRQSEPENLDEIMGFHPFDRDW